MIVTIDGEPYSVSRRVEVECHLKGKEANEIDRFDGMIMLQFSDMKCAVTIPLSSLTKICTGTLSAFEVSNNG